MGVQYTVRIGYDAATDIYFINGANSEVVERKGLIDHFVLLAKFFELQGQQFSNLAQLLELLKSFGMQYIIQNRRKADFGIT